MKDENSKVNQLANLDILRDINNKMNIRQESSKETYIEISSNNNKFSKTAHKLAVNEVKKYLSRKDTIESDTVV